jgi:hypothetical protein
MYDEEEIIYFRNEEMSIEKLLFNKRMIEIELENIKLNDLIYIKFIPYSQKYIYRLYPKYGRLLNDNKIKTYKNSIEDLFHDTVSYYGESLGYDYVLYKIEKNVNDINE